MGDFMQLDYASKVRGIHVPDTHLSDHRNGALCTHHEHSNYADDRLLREGSRVTVAVVADTPTDKYRIEELECLHCPISPDLTETVVDFSMYDETNVIIAEATLAPADTTDLILIEPHILRAQATIPGL